MADNRELKKLSRAELLEMLLEQSKEVERLTNEVNNLKEALEKKEILLKESGSIAEASLKLTNIFQEAQKAADMYIANTQKMEEESIKNVINNTIDSLKSYQSIYDALTLNYPSSRKELLEDIVGQRDYNCNA